MSAALLQQTDIFSGSCGISTIKEISLQIYFLKASFSSEFDKSINCKNYPYKNYKSFRDCDKAFIQHEVSQHSSGIIPFWETTNLSQVTEHQWINSSALALFYIAEGTTESNCPQPCLSTKVIIIKSI